jgi:hypothetical protein
MNELSYDAADARFEAALANLKNGGKVPKLSSMERQILEFCHNRDMKEFLREEFEKHPIRLNGNGELVGENPFSKEKTERGTFFDPLYDTIPREENGKMEKPYIYENYQYE